MIDLAELIATNVARCELWHPGFPDAEEPAEEWTIADWSNAMCGEAGEAANVVKKMRRIDTRRRGNKDADRDREELRFRLGDELADVILYATLLAAKEGIMLEPHLISKFNEVSTREGMPVFMAADGAALYVEAVGT